MEWGGWRQRKRIELFRPPDADGSGGGGAVAEGNSGAEGGGSGGLGAEGSTDEGQRGVPGDDEQLGRWRYVVGEDGQGPAVLDLWLVWRFRPDSCKFKDISLPAPAGNAAWGALVRRPGRDKRARGQQGLRALLPCHAGIGEQRRQKPVTEKEVTVRSALSLKTAAPQDRAVDELKYVDTPVWRLRNGEVLLGRDVIPHVGMRVVMSRQALRWRHETACFCNSAEDVGGLVGVGTITKIRAGTKELDRNGGPRYTRHDNATSVKVRWDASGRHTILPAGLRGNFHLVPLGQDALNLGTPQAAHKAVRSVVDALAATKFVTC